MHRRGGGAEGGREVEEVEKNQVTRGGENTWVRSKRSHFYRLRMTSIDSIFSKQSSTFSKC
jgi:hypothetical protein